MANKFIEKHKRKSVLMLLLLLFRGRTKYIALLVMVILFSIPFFATSDMIERFIGLSPIQYLIKITGLESMIARLYPNYSGGDDILKSAFDKLKDEYEANKIWNRILSSQASQDGLKNGRGTIDMVKVEDLSYRRTGNNSGSMGEGDIDGIIDREDVENGYGADGVDFNDLLSKNSLFSGGNNWGESIDSNVNYNSGVYMDKIFMGKNYPSYTGGYTGGIYMDKKIFMGKNYPLYTGKESISSSALDQIKENIPNVKDPTLGKGKVKVKKLGSVTAFAWRNVGYTKKGSNVDINISGSKRALFQMGETLATTSVAYKQNPQYEYQAAYVGSTYDGNSLNAGVVTTQGDSNTSVPDTAYVSDVIDSSQHWQEIAQKCSKAQSVHGTRISKLQDEIDDILKTMNNPPECCEDVGPWNNKVTRIIRKCNELNNESKQLAQNCGNTNPQIINCQTYGRMYIKPCSKWKCWLGIIFAIVGLLIGFLVGGFLGAVIGAAIGFALGSVASIYMQMAAMGAAFAGVGAYFADKKSKTAIKAVEDVNKDVADNGKGKQK